MGNYFSWFDIEEDFNLDAAELKKQFYLRSKEVHPDREAGDTDKSSYNNEAYNTLRSEIPRLKYLLELYGPDDLDEKLPQMFLMEMMEFNEKISEISSDADRKAAEKSIAEQEQELKSDMSALLSKKPGTLSPEEWRKVNEYLLKNRYMKRLRDQIK